MRADGAVANDVTFLLVRHGKTEFNTAGRVQGWCDSPLTPEGVALAEALGRGLADVPIAAAFASDLGRAVSTAELILRARAEARASCGIAAQPPSLSLDARLREWCYGDFEGQPGTQFDELFRRTFGAQLTMNELDVRLPEVADAIADADTTGKAERLADVEARCRSFFEEAARSQAACGGGTVLAVTHAFTIKTTIYLFARERVGVAGKIANESVTELRYHAATGAFEIGAISDTSYLEKGANLPA